jgi:hypothetical protein
MAAVRAISASVIVGLVVFFVVAWIADWEPQYGFLVFFSIVAAIVDYLTGFGSKVRRKNKDELVEGE